VFCFFLLLFFWYLEGLGADMPRVPGPSHLLPCGPFFFFACYIYFLLVPGPPARQIESLPAAARPNPSPYVRIKQNDLPPCLPAPSPHLVTFSVVSPTHRHLPIFHPGSVLAAGALLLSACMPPHPLNPKPPFLLSIHQLTAAPAKHSP
jgi:hypothetical protein